MEGKVIDRHTDSGVLTLRVLNVDTHTTDLLFYSEHLRPELYERATSELKRGVCISYEDTGYHPDYTLLDTDVFESKVEEADSCSEESTVSTDGNKSIVEKGTEKGTVKGTGKTGNSKSNRRRRRNNKGGRKNG